MNGPMALFIAFGAGLLSFVSPCTLPLLPGYLSYMSGLGAEEVKDRSNTGTLTGAAGLFVLGFSFVFVSLGATASYIGSEVGPNRVILTRLAGAFIIFMALFMLGVLRLPVLYMDKRLHVGRDFGIWSALPLGMAFGFGWSPCIGPVLSSIFLLATAQDTVQRGTLLLFVYALGLGAPFLLFALFAERMFRSLSWFKRHAVAINRTGGSILLVMGVFLILNRWTELLGPVLRWYADLNLPV